MSKRRNTKTLRKQEYPDMEDMDEVTPPPFNRLLVRDAVSDTEHVVKPTKPVVTYDNCGFHEGDIVTCPDTAKNKEGGNVLTTGTIVQILHGEASVLDAVGFIHRVSVKQIYTAQN